MVMANKDKGIIKKKPLMDILNRKVELKKEFIKLKKTHESEERQLELMEKINKIDDFLSAHRIQK